MPDFTLLISAQNNPYQAWMALVFAYSARRRFPEPVVVAVAAHPGDELLPEFSLVERTGATVLRHRDCVGAGPRRCLPRNTVGALAELRPETPLVVLCDPDFVFAGRVEFGDLGVVPGVATMDRIGHVKAGLPFNEGWLDEACGRLGVDHAALAARGTLGGVPYVLHADDRERLAREWLDCMEAFVQPQRSDAEPVHWVAVMWSAVFALDRLGIRFDVTDLQVHNINDIPMDRFGRPVIHYAYEDVDFGKRRHLVGEATRQVWDVKPLGTGSVSDRVRSEIAAAALFYGLDHQRDRERMLGAAR